LSVNLFESYDDARTYGHQKPREYVGKNGGVGFVEVHIEGMIYVVTSERPLAELAEALNFSLLISVGNVN